MSKHMDNLMEMLCRELDEIAQKGELSAGDLDTVYKLIMSKEKLLRIEEIEEDMDYSSRGGDWRAEGSYNRGGMSRRSYRGSSYDDGESYDGGYSSRRKHYVRGHYSYGDGDPKQMMMDMMNGNDLSLTQKSTMQKIIDMM